VTQKPKNLVLTIVFATKIGLIRTQFMILIAYKQHRTEVEKVLLKSPEFFINKQDKHIIKNIMSAFQTFSGREIKFYWLFKF